MMKYLPIPLFSFALVFMTSGCYSRYIDELERDAKLPEVLEPENPNAKYLTVDVSKEGKYSVAGKTYNEKKLHNIIGLNRNKYPQQKVMIRAHGKSPMKYAARVMGMCNNVGVEYTLTAFDSNEP